MAYHEPLELPAVAHRLTDDTEYFGRFGQLACDEAEDKVQLGPSSLQKLWWRCPECEHEWQTSSQSRVGGGYGCPC